MPKFTLDIRNNDFKFEQFLKEWENTSPYDYFKDQFFELFAILRTVPRVLGKVPRDAKLYFNEKTISSISIFMNTPTDDNNKCSFDYQLVYNKQYRSGRKKGFRVESENLCLKTKTDIDKILGLKNSIYHNEPLKLIISYDCSKKMIDTGELSSKNSTLFNAVNEITNNSNDVATNEINLKSYDYYKFITTLFVLDPYHDFRRGFRNEKRCTKFCKSKVSVEGLKHHISRFLESQKNKLQSEYLKLSNNNTVQLGDFFNLFENNESDYEGNILKHFTTTISKEGSQEGSQERASYGTYSSTKQNINDLKVKNPLVSLRYISNNAISINNTELYNMKLENSKNFIYEVTKKRKGEMTSGEEVIEISFGGTISDSCKSLPASLYDGCDSGHCGNLKSNLKYDSGLELGCYDITFRMYGENNIATNNYTQFKSEFLREGNDIFQIVHVNRSVQIIPSENPITYEAQFKYPIINNDNFIRENVTVDDELENYFKTDEVLNSLENIKFGTLLKSINHNLNVDVIHTSRKALCDFGQYLNGMLKNGGYYGNIVQNKNTVTPSGYFPDGPSDYVTKPLTNLNDYPFLAMHGDQPAAALNMFLLSVIPSNFVNNFSHMVYGTKDEFVFANYEGRITQVPVSQKKGGARGGGKWMTGGTGGDDYKNDKLLGEMYNTLFDFFYLCISFEMEQNDIDRYNTFYNNYLKDKNYEETIANFSVPTFITSYESIKDIVDTKMGEILNEETDAVAQGVGAEANTVVDDNNTPLKTPPKGSPQGVSEFSTGRINEETTSGNKPIRKKPKPLDMGEGDIPLQSKEVDEGSFIDDDNKGGSKNKTRKMNKKQKKNRKTKSKRRYIRKTSKRFTKFKSSSSSNKKTRKV